MTLTSVIAIFQDEAHDHLESLEEALLELEETPRNSDLIDRAFRAIHTIKGSGGIVGFQALCSFTHHLETVLDQIRSGNIELSPELISIFLESKDHILQLLGDPDASNQQILDGNILLEKLYAITPKLKDTVIQSLPPGSEVPSVEIAGKTSLYHIHVIPEQDALRNGFDLRPIILELNALGECWVTTLYDGIPNFNAYDPEHCYLDLDIIIRTEESKDTLLDVFIFVQDDWQVNIRKVDLDDLDETSDRLGQLLIDRGVISHHDLSEAMNNSHKLGSRLKDRGLVDDSQINIALKEQQITRKTKRDMHSEITESTVKVPANRLDRLMNLVGELVIVQARMNQVANSRKDEDILAISEDLEHLITELRDNTFSIRMLPIGSTFGRFRRLVRDVSQDLGKQITLHTEGAETELDKMMIDKLADPLVHLIRNSIDHGIETPEKRKTLGKDTNANIWLRATHADSQVVISVSDDGQGLDTDQIRKKAIERNLIEPTATLTQEQCHQLIFEPGFSTAQKVSDISGRGVGMDVVRRTIQDLGGKLRIESVPDQGTSLSISLPMTTAIINGLMVRVGEEHYVLPLNVVEECIELESHQGVNNQNTSLIQIRGEHVPYMSLRKWFQVGSAKPSIEQIVITSMGEERFGFCVDEVVGQYQTVIKRLGKVYEECVGYSGATILGDGSVAIVLDPMGLRNSVLETDPELQKAG